MNNVVSGLHMKPEKIVYVGYNDVMTKCAAEDVENFFKKYTSGIEIEFVKVKKFDYEDICNTLDRLIAENPAPVFDLTGGKELVLAAMGEVSARYDIPMIQYNVKDCRLVRVRNTYSIDEPERPEIDIKGCVMLNGGAVVPSETDEPVWNLTKGMKADIVKLWNICCENPLEWNRQTNAFSRLEQFADEYDKLRITVNTSRFSLQEMEKLFNERIVNKLSDCGILSDFSKKKNNIITFRYKNADIKRCILKAGNILELYTYMTAVEMQEKYPEEIDDVAVGVSVDWDGEIHKKYSDSVDIRNEIDVILMNKLVPVFISCKNGEVHKEALYELDTVAKHYGGGYAKKILVATYVDNEEISRDYILKRAEEMNITLIDGVDDMSYEVFFEKICNAILR